MGGGSRPGRHTALSIATAGILLLACESFSAYAISGSTLPRNVIVPLGEVTRLFPDIVREASTGRNVTATGSPQATRMVIYESGDGSKKVTITVEGARATRHRRTSRPFRRASRFPDSSRSGYLA